MPILLHMHLQKFGLYVYFLAALCISLHCNNHPRKSGLPVAEDTAFSHWDTLIKLPHNKTVKNFSNKDSISSVDWRWFSDSLFHRKDQLLAHYFRKYWPKDCPAQSQLKKDLTEGYEGYKKLGDINKDGKPDSVFVLPPFSLCDWEAGECYYFTDTSLPRMVPDSRCCHPNNVFMVPDIDGNSICEVGYYYSACTSRFKAVRLYRLKNRVWENIANASFDTFTQDPAKIKLETLVERLGKNQFRIRNFYEGKKWWDTVVVR